MLVARAYCLSAKANLIESRENICFATQFHSWFLQALPMRDIWYIHSESKYLALECGLGFGFLQNLTKDTLKIKDHTDNNDTQP